jgi:hypothetical protein
VSEQAHNALRVSLSVLLYGLVCALVEANALLDLNNRYSFILLTYDEPKIQFNFTTIKILIIDTVSCA